ncbi:hypothetical protein RI129_001280 [Pyrocoelia pectoralis]|uniref:DNA-directed DNA polymerase n=1 Tax=Pyrocoelia pectoralis TaxID=417401 RepID=A0AAN7VUF9_9COLE
MKGYDGCFVLRAMFENINSWSPQVISNGLKLISIKCGNIRFIDSLNFIPLPLSAIPKTFDFPESKGYFPYLFNTAENQNYVGPLPELKYYSPDDMSTKHRTKFLDWYNQEIQNGVVFRMVEEIINYCVTDVKILLKGCIRFWNIFKSSNYVDPFTEACTIASACNKVFRRRFLKPNTIGLIPVGGYRMADTQSKIALQWLRWIEHSQQISIQHAGKAREYRIPEGVKVDGYCKENNTIYEFLGCYWHGCEYCFPNQANFDKDIPMDRAMFIRNENTAARSQFLRSRGYNLIEMKECAFKNLISSNDQIKTFVNSDGNCYNMDPLNPRDAFFGGRTNASTLYYKCDGINEKILYYDVCSLYPFVNKYRKYPVGHPQIHVGNENCLKLSIDTVDGLIKCRVLPPDDLYHPVLPMRMHGKLMFVLCRTCCIDLNESDCGHSEHERSFVGTFVADELRKAISKNYKILDFHEIWAYKVVEYDKISKQGGLFSEYIDNFLKLKQECSGWPSDCTSDTEKLNYIEDFFKKEGIQLDFNNMKKNQGLRYLAKLMLNSFWGKFGQRENLVRCDIVSEPKDFFKLLANPLIQIQSIMPVSDDVMVVNWDRVEGEGDPLQTVNVAIAAYTTAHARLELYDYLEKLDRRVLYYDTDSIIFVQKPGDWHPLESYGPGSYISEFVSGGPKNYSYKVYSTRDCNINTICKVKGITLNFKNSEIINFNSMREMVLANSKDSIFVNNDRKIIRDRCYNVVSRPETKQYRIRYSKRRRIANFDTLPFGHKGVGQAS